MKVALTNLSNSLYENSRVRLNESAKRFGIADIFSYDFNDIKTTPFYAANREILDHPTGLGFWLWKPYIILETINKLDDGDIVVYADSGIEIINSLGPLLTICKMQEPIVLFANNTLPNFGWVKRDCFILTQCDEEQFWYSVQCDAAFILFRKCEKSVQFINEWLRLCTDKRIITDSPNTCGKKNLFGFMEHRRDQSVLSLLARRYKIPLHRMPTQYGNHYKAPAFRVAGEFNCTGQFDFTQLNYYAEKPFYNSPYYQLLDQHRSKNNSKAEKKPGNFIDKLKRRKKVFCYKLALWAHAKKIKKLAAESTNP